MSEVENVQAGVQRVDGGLINFGPVVNGSLIPFASQRQGDYDEAVAAAAQTGQQSQPAAPAEGQAQ